jgi:D-amino peptidase
VVGLVAAALACWESRPADDGVWFSSLAGAQLVAAELAPPAPLPAATPARRPIRKVYIVTDMEGVAGVRDAEQWCVPGGRYYDLGRKLLTLEVSAVVDGFFAGGATEVVVTDGHGASGVDIEYLDSRAQLERGWPSGWPGPSLLNGHFDGVAWVGQHAKAGTEHAHLAHTQGWNYVDLCINGVSIGEFGQLAMCASELGVRSIFASGDKAFTEEAQALVPGIETVCGKRGTTPGRGDELTAEPYGRRNTAAVHLHPVKVRELIRAGAERAMRRAQAENFGLIPLKPPFERVARFRPAQAGQPLLIARESHPSSVIALMNMAFQSRPEGASPGKPSK